MGGVLRIGKRAFIDSKKCENSVNRVAALAAFPLAEGGLMLAIRHRQNSNPYFHFHPLHTVFSLLGALILFGMMIWFLAVPAK